MPSLETTWLLNTAEAILIKEIKLFIANLKTVRFEYKGGMESASLFRFF